MTGDQIAVGIVFGAFGVVMATPVWGYFSWVYAMGPNNSTGRGAAVMAFLVMAASFTAGFLLGVSLVEG